MLRRRLLGTACALLVPLAWPLPANAAPGQLDAMFGEQGIVLTSFPDAGAWPLDVSLQPDGRIVVVGETFLNPGSDAGLARYLPSGDLDPSFGHEGLVQSDWVGGGNDVAQSSTIQPDGKIVVAGSSTVCSDCPQARTLFVVARYTVNGSLDQTFSGDGVKRTGFSLPNAQAFGATVTADGDVVAVGCVSQPDRPCAEVAVARYLSDGSLDPSFAGDGTKTSDLTAGSDVAFDVIARDDGRILIAGEAGRDFALATYLSEGSIDRTFGTRGWVRTDFHGGEDRATSMALQPDGRIVLTGSVEPLGDRYTVIGVARYRSGGALDREFDVDGKLTTPFGEAAMGLDVAVQPNGRIVVAGAATGTGSDYHFGLTRYRSNGILDPTFGGDGKVLTVINNNFSLASGLVIQSDGMIVVAGPAIDSDNVFALARYDG